MNNTKLSSDIPDTNIFKGMIVCKCCKKPNQVKNPNEVKNPNQVKKLIININENLKQ